MSETLESLRRKIDRAGELRSVVRTMKSLAASNIGQYERAVGALAEYYRTVELGLVACFHGRSSIASSARAAPHDSSSIGIVVFGSDQGLIGQFNDLLAEFVATRLRDLPGEKIVWAVGERMYSCLADAGLTPATLFAIPNSATAITPLVEQILITIETPNPNRRQTQVFIFHNRPRSAEIYEPTCRRLLPLDETWQADLADIDWPTRKLPEVLSGADLILPVLVREYLFVSMFQACAESLASENTSRLVAMQRAEKNIDELLENLHQAFHSRRQNSIDEELFDVLAGYESLTKRKRE